MFICIYIYIYIYIFSYIYICPKRDICIYMLLGSFAAPQNGSRAFICGPPCVHLRPPLFETTVFTARNVFWAVSGNQVSSLFSDFSGFSKMPFKIWRSSRSFFAVRKNFRFLRVFSLFLVWGLRGTVQEVVGRETLQYKGFRSNFVLRCLVHLRWARCIALMLQYIFDTNFSGSHKFVFSEVRIFDQFGFGRQGDFQNDVFPILPGRGPICEFLGAFSARNCVAVWVRFGPLPEICLRLRCGWFSRLFRGSSFSTFFANLKRDLLKLPSLLFVFCSFLRFLLEFGLTQPCTCVLGQLALNLAFLFVFCLPVYKNIVFAPEKRLFLFISLSPFLSHWLHSLLIFTLCLSLSLVLFLSFLVLLFLFVTFLVFLLFLSCLVSLLLFHDNNNIKLVDVYGFFSSIISVSFGFAVLVSLQSLFLISVFHYLSSVFW